RFDLLKLRTQVLVRKSRYEVAPLDLLTLIDVDSVDDALHGRSNISVFSRKNAEWASNAQLHVPPLDGHQNSRGCPQSQKVEARPPPSTVLFPVLASGNLIRGTSRDAPGLAAVI